jgi:hypothetical protein
MKTLYNSGDNIAKRNITTGLFGLELDENFLTYYKIPRYIEW